MITTDLIGMTALLALLLFIMLSGMRAMYGYWPWQEGPRWYRLIMNYVERDGTGILRAQPPAAVITASQSLDEKAVQQLKNDWDATRVVKTENEFVRDSFKRPMEKVNEATSDTNDTIPRGDTGEGKHATN